MSDVSFYKTLTVIFAVSAIFFGFMAHKFDQQVNTYQTLYSLQHESYNQLMFSNICNVSKAKTDVCVAASGSFNDWMTFRRSHPGQIF